MSITANNLGLGVSYQGLEDLRCVNKLILAYDREIRRKIPGLEECLRQSMQPAPVLSREGESVEDTFIRGKEELLRQIEGGLLPAEAKPVYVVAGWDKLPAYRNNGEVEQVFRVCVCDSDDCGWAFDAAEGTVSLKLYRKVQAQDGEPMVLLLYMLTHFVEVFRDKNGMLVQPRLFRADTQISALRMKRLLEGYLSARAEDVSDRIRQEIRDLLKMTERSLPPIPGVIHGPVSGNRYHDYCNRYGGFVKKEASLGIVLEVLYGSQDLQKKLDDLCMSQAECCLNAARSMWDQLRHKEIMNVSGSLLECVKSQVRILTDDAEKTFLSKKESLFTKLNSQARLGGRNAASLATCYGGVDTEFKAAGAALLELRILTCFLEIAENDRAFWENRQESLTNLNTVKTIAVNTLENSLNEEATNGDLLSASWRTKPEVIAGACRAHGIKWTVKQVQNIAVKIATPANSVMRTVFVASGLEGAFDGRNHENSGAPIVVKHTPDLPGAIFLTVCFSEPFESGGKHSE